MSYITLILNTDKIILLTILYTLFNRIFFNHKSFNIFFLSRSEWFMASKDHDNMRDLSHPMTSGIYLRGRPLLR